MVDGTNALGEHFKNSKCESKFLLLQVIEKVIPESEHMLLQRERHWIHKLDTKTPHGLNTMV